MATLLTAREPGTTMRGPYRTGDRVWGLRDRSYVWRSSDGFMAVEGFFSGEWIFYGGKYCWTIVASIDKATTPEHAFALVSDYLDKMLATELGRE